MLKRANIQWSGKTLCNQIEKGQVLFDCAVQRNPCWDLSRKSLLIHSMIMGYPIPPFYFARRPDKKYDALDGLQRSTAIGGFLREEYSLSMDTPPIADEDEVPVNVAGKKMSELPDWAQDNIKDYSLTIYYFEDINDDEIQELFFRINNGKPLTGIELFRAKTKCIKEFQEIASHPLIDSAISEAGKKRRDEEKVAMQSWMLCFSGVLDFSSKVFWPLIERAEVTEPQISRMHAAMDYVKAMCDSLDEEKKEDRRVLRRIKARSHLVSSIYLAFRAIEEGTSQEDFGKILYGFFDSTKTSVSDIYNASVGAGSAKPDKVRSRVEVLDSLI